MLSDVTSLIESNRWGFALLVFFIYQLYWPSWLHPSEPKLRLIFPHDVIDTLVDVVAQLTVLHPDMDEDAVKRDLDVNGSQYRRDDPRAADGGKTEDGIPDEPPSE